MKRFLAFVLLLALTLAFAACGGKEEPGDEMVLSVEPGASTATPGASGINSNSPGFEGEPSASPDPSGNIAPGEEANASPTPPGPSVSLDPNDPDVTENPTPIPSNYPKTLAEAKKINSDTIGWIKVPNTNIDYPIMYSKDINYYNNHDIFKKKTGNPGAGSIYAYYNVLTRNNIVTGHNMRQTGTMFHELHKVQNNKSNLKTRANRIFKITYLEGFKEWEVFALYETKDNEPESTLMNNIKHLSKSSKADVEKWVAAQKKRSEIDLDVDVTGDDVIMTLITCGDNYDSPTAQSRLYIFLKGLPPTG